MKLAIKAVDKPFNVFAILIIILVLGYTAFRILPKQTYPDINAGHVLVTIPYPEATAHDIEVSIAKEIESRLFTEIEDIDFLRMISSAGYAVVHFKFNVKTGLDIDKKIDEIKKIIDELKVNFPKGVKDAQYLKFDFSKVVFMELYLLLPKK